MDGPTRRAMEMGARVAKLKLPQPDGDTGYSLAAAKVEGLVTRGAAVATDQRDGIVDRHAASVQKEKVRRYTLAGPIAHLAKVGRVAEQEQHELGSMFRFRPRASTLLAFRTAAGSMLANGETHRGGIRPAAAAVRRRGGVGRCRPGQARRRHPGIAVRDRHTDLPGASPGAK